MEGDSEQDLRFLSSSCISIHSLRMEGDWVKLMAVIRMEHFNPLPPHGGRHDRPAVAFSLIRYFNPLPPHGGRLCLVYAIVLHVVHFNPLPPHGGRRNARFLRCHLPAHFNPLPPHGGRLLYILESIIRHTFQSTPSAWRETGNVRKVRHRVRDFNPLPPHGGRLRQRFHLAFAFAFQSTPSAWRETAKLHRKAFFISPILVQSCKKGCKRLHSAPEKMVFFEKREKNLVRNLQHLSVRL